MKASLLLSPLGRELPVIPRGPEDLPGWVDLLAEISAGLSRVLRCNGRTRLRYSVAQHSVLVAELAGGSGAETALPLLLHDAAEAFIGDCIKPVKDVCADLQAVEEAWVNAIYGRFGIPKGDNEKQLRYNTAKALFDPLALRLELEHFGHVGDVKKMGLSAYDSAAGTCSAMSAAARVLGNGPWNSHVAAALFIQKFYDYTYAKD